MISIPSWTRAAHLRQSYIEISDIVRQQTFGRRSLRRLRYPPSAGVCAYRSFSTRASLRSSVHSGDVTEGFPTPPEASVAEQFAAEPEVDAFTSQDGDQVQDLNSPDGEGTEESPGSHHGVLGTPRARRIIAGGTGGNYHQYQAMKRHLGYDRAVGGLEKSDVPTAAQSVLRDYARFDFTTNAAPTLTWEALENPESAREHMGTLVEITGFVTSIRKGGENDFIELADPFLRRSVQLVAIYNENVREQQVPVGMEGSTDLGKEGDVAAATLDQHLDLSNVIYGSQKGTGKIDAMVLLPLAVKTYLRSLKAHTPVTVLGVLKMRTQPPAKKSGVRNDPYIGTVGPVPHAEIMVRDIRPLNDMTSATKANHGDNIPPQLRHLQFRTDSSLRHKIRLRSKATAEARKFLFLKGFDEIETPVLFKSTPEGAREFVVPSRRKGLAYALPQSPQQYKQLLMASGFSRYFQFAKCFRDEDMRADRQPEFTQLDLEMSFGRPSMVMVHIERLILQSVLPIFYNSQQSMHDLSWDPPIVQRDYPHTIKSVFASMTYKHAMEKYGSDKPDVRLKSMISPMTEWITPELQKMLTSLDNPVIEGMKINMKGARPDVSSKLITDFLDSASSTYTKNPHGMPGITVFDSSKPLNGLASLGHAGASVAEKMFHLASGDILVLQARPSGPATGSSTALGNLRREIHQAAVEQGLRPAPTTPVFVWVRNFPLFSRIEEGEGGNDGETGICSTHHPFTAPMDGQDLSLLYTDPLSVIGSSFDLVLNGVEVGGGSTRIHSAKMQELILRDVLKMKPERVEDFRHLLNALGDGCPPHTGFALGWDRLLAILTNSSTIRDVIAFPKDYRGDDKMVGSPALLTPDQLSTYHLKISDEPKAEAPQTVSIKA